MTKYETAYKELTAELEDILATDWEQFNNIVSQINSWDATFEEYEIHTLNDLSDIYYDRFDDLWNDLRNGKPDMNADYFTIGIRGIEDCVPQTLLSDIVDEVADWLIENYDYAGYPDYLLESVNDMVKECVDAKEEDC